MKQVYITDYMTPPPVLEQKELESIAEVACLLAKSEEELRGRVERAHGLIVCHEVSIGRQVIESLEHCEAIVRCGVGFDQIDLQAAGECGIPVCNVPDYGVDEVADHAIMMMLACNRGLIRAERGLKQSLSPWGYHSVFPVHRLAGETIGIIGLGRIGIATAKRAQAHRMNVIAYDPYLRPGMDKALNVQMMDFDDLLAESDVVSIHTPLTEETRHIIDAEALSKMKSTAILVNTARGAIVDIDALAEALKNQRIAGAGIDVLPVEPPNEKIPLIKMWREDQAGRYNLIITPHSAFYSEEGMEEMRTKAARELANILKGDQPVNLVNGAFLK
ncbi:MAG TPA: C-terminal binding protein [Verrucomicrobiales bacterium]|nr:C-terminal binding protein [Verrucomicrobiales bacterium]HIL70147.1 C-terminal binding protein [Verrucomicrobiota bacterium]